MVFSSAGREHAWKTEKWHPPTFEPSKRQASLKGWKPHFLKFTLFAPENRLGPQKMRIQVFYMDSVNAPVQMDSILFPFINLFYPMIWGFK